MKGPQRIVRKSGARRKRGLSFGEFRRLAGRIVDEIPPRLCRDLNGGFVALPEEKRDGELLVLGEYVWDGVLGRRVVLYYGSFAALLGGRPRGVWEREIRRTLRHELRHHLESLAGADDLAREDLEFLARLHERRGAAAGVRPGKSEVWEGERRGQPEGTGFLRRWPRSCCCFRA